MLLRILISKLLIDDINEIKNLIKANSIDSVVFDNSILSNKKIIAQEKYHQPPGRYSEATLIKKMEKMGIGRS